MSEVCQRCVMFPSSCPGRMRLRVSSWWAGGPGYPRFRRNCLGQSASECVCVCARACVHVRMHVCVRVCECVFVCSFILFMVSLEHSFFHLFSTSCACMSLFFVVRVFLSQSSVLGFQVILIMLYIYGAV